MRVLLLLEYKSERILTPCVQCPHCSDLRVWRAMLTAYLLQWSCHIGYKNVFIAAEVIEYVSFCHRK